MPLTGVITFPNTIVLSLPAGSFSLIGEDGNHYAIGNTSNLLNVGCAETNSVIYTRTQAQWRTDLAGLSMGTSGNYTMTAVVPVKGTALFWQLGYKTAEPDSHCVGVRYRIVSTGSVVVDGGLFLHGGDNAVPTAYCWGAGVVGDYCYAVIDTGFGNPSFSLEEWLIELPLTGNLVDTAAGATSNHQTRLAAWASSSHYSWNSFRGFVDGERVPADGYTDKVAVIEDPTTGNVGLLRYIGEPASTKLYYLVVNPSAHTIGSVVDVSADFGVPFADAGLNYAGSASAYAQDDYTAPSIGPDSEVIFVRGFEDEPTEVRVRNFTFGGVGNVLSLGTFDFTHNAETFSTQVFMAQAYRAEADGELLVMIRDATRFIFGYFGAGGMVGSETRIIGF